MINMIAGKLKGKLASPFMLVCGTQADCCMWPPLFTVCYFHHMKGGKIIRFWNQANSMDGIAVGHSPTPNVLLVYNPCKNMLWT